MNKLCIHSQKTHGLLVDVASVNTSTTRTYTSVQVKLVVVQYYSVTLGKLYRCAFVPSFTWRCSDWQSYEAAEMKATCESACHVLECASVMDSVIMLCCCVCCNCRRRLSDDEDPYFRCVIFVALLQSSLQLLCLVWLVCRCPACSNTAWAINTKRLFSIINRLKLHFSRALFNFTWKS